MSDITYPRVDGHVSIQGAFHKGDALFLPRKAASKILKFPGWEFRRITFRKRLAEERRQLRREFESDVRKRFLQWLAEERRAEILSAGLVSFDLDLMERGLVPPTHNVHHIIPLDDGGDNAFENLILLRSEKEHRAMTAFQNRLTRGLREGQSIEVDYPMPTSSAEFRVYPPDSRGAPVELTLWSTKE